MGIQILVIDHGGIGEFDLAILKEKYGDDIVVVGLEEAIQKGMKPEDFANIPTYKITAPRIDFPEMTMKKIDFVSGKLNRNERREMQRKAERKHKY
jgi:hypothetical protein